MQMGNKIQLCVDIVREATVSQRKWKKGNLTYGWFSAAMEVRRQENNGAVVVPEGDLEPTMFQYMRKLKSSRYPRLLWNDPSVWQEHLYWTSILQAQKKCLRRSLRKEREQHALLQMELVKCWYSLSSPIVSKAGNHRIRMCIDTEVIYHSSRYGAACGSLPGGMAEPADGFRRKKNKLLLHKLLKVGNICITAAWEFYK